MSNKPKLIWFPPYMKMRLTRVGMPEDGEFLNPRGGKDWWNRYFNHYRYIRNLVQDNKITEEERNMLPSDYTLGKRMLLELFVAIPTLFLIPLAILLQISVLFIAIPYLSYSAVTEFTRNMQLTKCIQKINRMRYLNSNKEKGISRENLDILLKEEEVFYDEFESREHTGL